MGEHLEASLPDEEVEVGAAPSAHGFVGFISQKQKISVVVLDEYPGIEVVIRNNGLIVKDYPVPGIDWTRYGSHGSIFPGVSAYVESSEAGAFSVSITVDRKYDFSRDQNHLLCFSTWMESRNPKDKRIITKQHVAAGHGRAHVSCDITLSYRDSWEILGSPIGERGFGGRQPSDIVRSPTGEPSLCGTIHVCVSRVAMVKPERPELTLQDAYNIADMDRRGIDTTNLESCTCGSWHNPIIASSAATIPSTSIASPRSREGRHGTTVPGQPAGAGRATHQEPDLPAAPAIANKSRGPVERQELIELRDRCKLMLWNINWHLSELPDLDNESSERPAKRPRQREKRVEIIDLTED
ncbi:hypothetical protein PG999_010252 [Apiospora kogelbergensis]|uniref:Uncharacterized protein n=1 Tax=Apiospora kogelbergensis TaxID=1337665 RepID=A0AAW0QF96_9PEZI